MGGCSASEVILTPRYAAVSAAVALLSLPLADVAGAADSRRIPRTATPASTATSTITTSSTTRRSSGSAQAAEPCQRRAQFSGACALEALCRDVVRVAPLARACGGVGALCQAVADPLTPEPTALCCVLAVSSLAGYPGGILAKEMQGLGIGAALSRIGSRGKTPGGATMQDDLVEAARKALFAVTAAADAASGGALSPPSVVMAAAGGAERAAAASEPPQAMDTVEYGYFNCGVSRCGGLDLRTPHGAIVRPITTPMLSTATNTAVLTSSFRAAGSGGKASSLSPPRRHRWQQKSQQQNQPPLPQQWRHVKTRQQQLRWWRQQCAEQQQQQCPRRVAAVPVEVRRNHNNGDGAGSAGSGSVAVSEVTAVLLAATRPLGRPPPKNIDTEPQSDYQPGSSGSNSCGGSGGGAVLFPPIAGSGGAGEWPWQDSHGVADGCATQSADDGVCMLSLSPLRRRGQGSADLFLDPVFSDTFG
eukprot:TRINITY_DN3686_c0_g1_i2.p2 TRINITY_DN3686_c0_g1~~TRINITY_DN3686_c0_g1_i2.p2  ORF type:complete len:476 (-),score=145.75 TRINITY_DN3686_c0_g1_i2:116-1543(-)